MTREDLKQHLWKLSAMLRELDSKAEPISRALGLQHKGDAIYTYLENMEIDDALDAYKGLTPEQQLRFRVVINNGDVQ